ncbi:SDR family NAD(P)-dependent oxidoreductase [Streptomyces specialis]|uniref:SDR family NAD(P)-dependent oxidoreductase n=1 Tax=Streptomyces specialis TaxID=498367 RepID=UPI001F448BFB|nr:SDR family NAD(P)-dependent oxidoreductase [Streptomyces specialis]
MVLGAGPGLGMSMAHRFGREGFAVALISRHRPRHEAYLASLAEAGVPAASFTADVRDRHQLLAALDAARERFGRVDVAYYGPSAADPGALPAPIDRTDAASVREAMNAVYPAFDVVGGLLPGMTERGDGALLFAGGLAGVVPLPQLGALAISSAALRNYALTLHAALADRGVYAGVLSIGGLIERSDVHRMVTARPERFGRLGLRTLDPDRIADAAWDLVARRDRAEAVFNTWQ